MQFWHVPNCGGYWELGVGLAFANEGQNFASQASTHESRWMGPPEYRTCARRGPQAGFWEMNRRYVSPDMVRLESAEGTQVPYFVEKRTFGLRTECSL